MSNELKKQAESRSDYIGSAGYGLIEFALKDPKGFKRYMRDLDRLFEE